jgi:hypothetical protein
MPDDGETSANVGIRGGDEMTRTACQARSPRRTGLLGRWIRGSTAIDGPPESLQILAFDCGFRGWYEPDDDDFKARTFFCSPPQIDGEQPRSARTISGFAGSCCCAHCVQGRALSALSADRSSTSFCVCRNCDPRCGKRCWSNRGCCRLPLIRSSALRKSWVVGQFE